MSLALANSFVARLSSLSPVRHQGADSDDTRSISSSQGTCSSSSSSSSIDTDTIDSCDSQESRLRHNEHLAILLPKHLWKPDSQASICDTFLCRKRFSILERRHHCRKCGGVFCGECSTHSTRLLDSSNLEFFHPPRDIPISAFESPLSPIVHSRVCDDCFDQIHGTKSSRSPIISASSCSSRTLVVAAEDFVESSTRSSRASSPASSIITTPIDGQSPVRPSFRRLHSSPRIPSSPLRDHSLQSSVHIADADLGELEAYPLRHASAICKATGGGRWEPKPIQKHVGYRIPGVKPAHELELEREDEERRIRRLNPIIRDGDFQLRVPREIEPRSPGGPITLSTF